MSATSGDPDSDSPSVSSLDARVRGALANRYDIQRRIGSGGMATVYLAEDPRHQRQVAVKVLRAELASALGAERFLREIRIAAQLQHPHILPLLDSGDVEGVLYYVMPFVQGESLRERLQREGQLPIGDAVRVLRDVTDALAYAHAHDVVHRDVKPDNIMLSGRHALLMDFGVAKAVSQAARHSGQSTLTTRGISIGTPAYMAPEQALADPNLDHRVDIYAVGIVGYELLTGAFPFAATTPEAVLSAHVTEAPTPVSDRRAGVPPALGHLVMKCLEKNRADRWQSAEELVHQLEALATPSGGTQSVAGVRRRPSRVLLGVVASVLIAVVVWMWIRPRTRVTVLPSSRQLTFSGTVWEVALSPDGRYVAYTTGTMTTQLYPPMHLMVQETKGGQALERAVFDHVGEIHWSGDGQGVLVNGVIDSSYGTWVVPVIGGEPRLLSPHGAVESPDGRRVAEGFDSLGRAIRLRNIGTQASETLEVHFRGSRTGTWAWSPTGQALAILVEPQDSPRIETITVDGRNERVLLGPEGAPLTLWWAKGAIYYTRREGQAVQLWKIPVSSETGRARGKPKLVLPTLERGIGGIGFESGSDDFSISADGSRLVYVRAVPRGNLYSLLVRPGSPTPSEASELTTGTWLIGGMKLSPDGGRIALSAGRPGDIDIFSMSSEGGPVRQLTYLNLRAGANIAWSPDGQGIVFCAADNTGWHVWTLPSLGAAPRRLTRSNAAEWCYLAWGPADLVVYTGPDVIAGAAGGHARVLDLASGQERPLVNEDSGSLMNTPQVSPDGKEVAVYWQRPDRAGLWVLSMVDTTRRFLMAGDVPMRWSARGEAVYASRGQDVFRVPFRAGAATLLARLPAGWNCGDLDITPDGRRLICSREESQRDAWLIENFDPDVLAPKP